ncbi:MAG: hypothetical protein WCE38_16315 [Burkholderiales bacterium]
MASVGGGAGVPEEIHDEEDVRRAFAGCLKGTRVEMPGLHEEFEL